MWQRAPPEFLVRVHEIYYYDSRNWQHTNVPLAHGIMAVNCSWADAQVQADVFICSVLPTEVLQLIVSTTGRRYLDVLASTSLRPSCTDKFFILYEPLIVELTAQWLRRSETEDVVLDLTILSGLARILPLAPYLKPRVKSLLESSKQLRILGDKQQLSSINLSDEQLLNLLLAWFRLLSYDLDSFRFVLSPLQLFSLIKHANPSIRCLAIQCIGLQEGLADAALQDMTMAYVGDAPAKGRWEGKMTDYRWLMLFEEDRWRKLHDELDRVRSMRPETSHCMEREVTRDILSPSTAELATILIPRSNHTPLTQTPFVHTPTADRNLKSLARSLLEPTPILVTGKAGSGKTSLINEAARELNKLSSMIVLHLNEQTDAKSLIGLYTTSSEEGSFVWQPGVLTRAMEDGRWLLIENIDRAPSEVIGVLLPVIERGELLLPSRKEKVRAADDFRIFATMKTSGGPGASLPRSLLGSFYGRSEARTRLRWRERFAAVNSHYRSPGACVRPAPGV